MALTRDFKETIQARARQDPRFRESLFTEALNAYLAGDTAAGKAILRDLVNATIGFEGLSEAVNKPSKSLHRMLAPSGNPSTENFFGIIAVLQKRTLVRLKVTARAAKPTGSRTRHLMKKGSDPFSLDAWSSTARKRI